MAKDTERDSIFSLSECPIPDLSELPGNIPSMVADVVGGGGPQARVPSALWRSYIRLIDKAVMEYQMARQEFADLTADEGSGPRIKPYFRIVDHFENCLNTLNRAIRIAQKFTVMANDTAPITLFEQSVFKESSRIREFRNAIEHVDGKVLGNQIKEGENIFIKINPEYIMLMQVNISYNELAEWIRQLYRLARVLAEKRGH